MNRKKYCLKCPFTGNISGVKTSGIRKKKERKETDNNCLPVTKSVPSNFWGFLTIEELAKAQHVCPIDDISIFFGTWPGDNDDKFEEEIRQYRKGDISISA